MKTKLICFEGPNGVGKSTILDRLRKEFYIKGISCKTFKDSGYPEMIKVRRNIREGSLINPLEIVRSVAQARGEVYRQYLDLKEESEFLFLDRGYYTSAILQSQGDIPISRVIEENLSVGIPIPDRTFILMAPLEILLKRIAERERNKPTKYSPEFLMKQIRGYLEIARNYEECSLVDNSESMSLTMDRINEVFK